MIFFSPDIVTKFSVAVLTCLFYRKCHMLNEDGVWCKNALKDAIENRMSAKENRLDGNGIPSCAWK